jgi:AcrR family transcriptional regulator
MPIRVTPQKREEKDRVRAGLLRAALTLGAAHGFASLGLREVARAADIAPTSFYRHFADMVALGEAVVEELVGPLVAELCAVLQHDDQAANARALSDSVLQNVARDPELVRFLIAERVGAFPALRKALTEQLDQLAHALSEDRLRADVALAVLVDGVSRALDAAPPARAKEATRLARALHAVLQMGSR